MYIMNLISTEAYAKANVHHLILQKTGEIWASIKNAGSSMGVKNISDLVLKEIHAYLIQKTLQKSKLTNTK